jgi:hypothetical protein
MVKATGFRTAQKELAEYRTSSMSRPSGCVRAGSTEGVERCSSLLLLSKKVDGGGKETGGEGGVGRAIAIAVL